MKGGFNRAENANFMNYLDILGFVCYTEFQEVIR